MKSIIMAVFLVSVPYISRAGFSCPGDEVDKWGHCGDSSTFGKQFYIDGIASCLHPCSATETELIETAKIEAQRIADIDQRCGYKMVVSGGWSSVTVQTVSEGARVWTMAKAGAIFSCQ